MTEENEFKQKCIETIANATDADGRVLVDAPPALGKTTGAVRWAAETGEPTTIYTERHDLFDQITEQCDDLGLTWSVLPSYHYHCPTGGKRHKHGDEWKKAFSKMLNEGFSARKIHEDATTLFGEELPCQAEGPCEYIQAFEKEEEEEPDVLVGYYTHLLRSETFEDRHVFIDEFPGDSLLIEFSSDDRNDAISEYLRDTDALPLNHINEVEVYQSLKSEGHIHAAEAEVQEWLEGPEGTNFKSTKWHVREYNPRRAAFAPHLLRAALTERELGGGSQLRLSRLPDGTLVVRESNKGVKIRPPIAVDGIKEEGEIKKVEPTSVVGLDGTPSFSMWKAILGEDLESRPVLNDTEKREWLRDLGIEIIQLTERTVPCLGNRSKPHEDYTLIESIERREGQKPFIVGSKDEIEELVKLDPSLADRSAYYGNLKGLNEHGGEEVALIIGSPQLNDEAIALWAAFNGKPAVPATDENGNRLRGKKLDYGKVGNKILRGTRDNEVLQAILRFSRKETDSTTRVYVYTSAIPEWVQPTECFVTHRMWDQKGLNQVIRALTEGEDWQSAERTTREIADLVTELFSDDAIGMDMVRAHLKRLDEEMGLIRGTRKGRDYVWTDNGLDRRAKFGMAVFNDA